MVILCNGYPVSSFPLAYSHFMTIATYCPPVWHYWDREHLLGQIHSNLTLPRIVNMSMRKDSKIAQHVAAQVSACRRFVDTSSSPPAVPVAAGARGITPRVHDDSDLEAIYSGGSALSDSEKASGAPVSQPESSLKAMPNQRTRDFRHSLFGSDNKDDDDEYE